MESIIVRKLAPALKKILKSRAAKHGRSMEEEAREIFKMALSKPDNNSGDLVTQIRKRFRFLGDTEIELPLRDGIREK